MPSFSHLRVAAMSVAVLPLAAVSALAQAPAGGAALSCPERFRTTAATVADPARIAGFEPVKSGPTDAQNFLQDIAIRSASSDAGAPLPGKADGTKKIVWAFDGEADLVAACVYEGGVSLTRPLGRPKSCTADVQRSKDTKDASNWGMEKVSLRCR